MHDCPVRKCGRDVGDRRLMCAEHWQQVPAALRAEVGRWWRAGDRPLELVHAQLDAIRAVNSAKEQQ